MQPAPQVAQQDRTMSSRETLRNFVRANIDNRPGVYRMLGPGEEVLYVGKSIRVRTRLLSYFRAAHGEKAFDLMNETTAVDWEYVPNELGALVREMKQIQAWRPRFNVQHKRKRSYAFVKLTSEQAPRLVPVRRVVKDNSRYYGPFPALGRMADAVRSLTHVMGLRDCAGATPVFYADQLELFAAARTPLCLRAELRSCLAPCAGGTHSADYARRVAAACSFLEGTSDEPVRMLRSSMADAARRRQFEYAAALRDRAAALEEFQEQLTAFRGHLESLSFVYKVPGYDGDDRIYLIRKGRIRRELPLPRTRVDREHSHKAVREVFSGPDVAPSALEPEEAAEILLIARWFRINPEERRRTVAPERWVARRGRGQRRARRRSTRRAPSSGSARTPPSEPVGR
jgi:excinuclease ABC subunit C